MLQNLDEEAFVHQCLACQILPACCVSDHADQLEDRHKHEMGLYIVNKFTEIGHTTIQA